jgi:hypothetical protein
VKVPKSYIKPAERYDIVKAYSWGYPTDAIVAVPSNCPGMPMVVGSTDKQQVIDTLKKFSINASTGGDEGIAWAMRALSPKWREIWEAGGNYPAEYHGDTEKRILYMAGSNTFGYNGNAANYPNALGEMCEKIKENGVDLFIVRGNETINAASLANYEACVTTPERNYKANSKPEVPEIMAQMAVRQYHVRLAR